jgi:DNA-binding MarR family transcriptional regulator
MSQASSTDHIISLTFDLSRIMRHTMMCASREGVELNFLQIQSLALIESHKGMTMKELAEHLRIASPTATSFIGRMEKLGWVERMHDPKNRKLVRLRLTRVWKNMFRAKKAQRMKVIRRIINLLPPEDQRVLAVLLEKLHKSCLAAQPQ